MANFAFPLALSAALVSALTYGAVTNPAPTAVSYVAVENSFETADHKVWELKNKHSNTLCLIQKTRRVSSATSTLKVDSACDAVFPGSEFVSVWQEDEFGNVNFADDHGNVLAEFAYDTDTGLVSITAEPGSLTLSPSS